MTDSIDILVLADRDAKPLWPLTEALPPSLLPMGGKPLIAHVIEALSTCVTAKVTVVVADGDTRTAAFLARSGYPRLTLTVTDQPVPVVDRDMLVFRGDVVTTHDEICAFVAHHGAPDAAPCERPEQAAWRLRAGDLTPTWRHTAMLLDQSDRMLPSVAAYWRASIAASRGDFTGLDIAGWSGPDGVRAGVDARIMTRRAPGSNVHVGSRAFVDKLVRIGDNVVVGDDAFVARGAVIANAVIMPGCYVGPGLELENVIVAGDWLCRIDTGSVIRIADRTVLGRIAA
jgi:NDP-sugar pyrophosphorylase family protein